MRVVTGQWAGQHLQLSSLPRWVRPTSNFAKEGLFNILLHNYVVKDATVLDLFAGSGGMSLEFLSCGAKHVSMVERSNKVSQQIEENFEKMNVPKTSYHLFKQSVLDYLKHTSNSFDFIFADPPFQDNYLLNIVDIIKEKKTLSSKGMFVYECSTHTQAKISFSRKAVYGDTQFLIFEASCF